MQAFLAALLAFFALGTFGFYLLLALAIGIVTALEENEHTISAVITLGIFAAAVGALKPIGHAVVAHPWWTSLYVLAYFVGGIVWAVAKWTLFVRRNYEKFTDYKNDYVANREERIKNMGPTRGTVNDDSFASGVRSANIEYNPKIRDHKEDFMRWATFWPMSFIWTMISDPITKIFRHIYFLLQNTLQGISDKMFAKTNMDLPLPPVVVETAETVKAKFAASERSSGRTRFEP
jgi:hypothetical protein